MVICKYFLRGTCRFGDGCKNEHSYNNENSASILRKKPDMEPSMLVKSVSNDMDKAEKGNQWPLSCYGPFQGKPCLPGFEDKCFEEIRLGMYEAERNGTVEQYRQQLTLLLQEARLKMRLLQNPTPEVTNVLKELYTTSAGDGAFAQPQAPSVFRNSAGGGSIFGNTGATPQNQNPFLPAASTFAGPADGLFSNASIFSQQPGAKATFQSGSIFSNAAPNQSIFAGPQPGFPANTVYPSQNIFASAQPAHSHASPFGEPAQATGNSPFAPAPTGTASNSPFSPAPTGAASNSPFAPAPTGTASNSPFGTAPTGAASNSPFAPAPAGAATNSPFASPPASNSPFAVPQPPAPNPLFTASQPVASSSPFGPSPLSAGHQPANPSPFTAGPSIFSANAPPDNKAGNMFAQQPAEQSFFAPVRSQPSSAVEHSASIFGGAASTAPSRAHDASVYSTATELSDTDRSCYEAHAFEFGRIPELAPSVQLCSR